MRNAIQSRGGVMNLLQWSKSGVKYGRKLVDSAVAGARTGEQEFLHDEPLVPYLGGAARQALAPAAIGACLGAFAGSFGNHRASKARALAAALLGGAVGFTAAVIWDNREFTTSVASGAWKTIRRTRDEHWLESHPIDYA